MHCHLLSCLSESEHQSPPATKHDPLLSTSHLYYTDTYLFSCTAKVLAVQETMFNDTMYTTVILDQTVMHPQGGNDNYNKKSSINT